jgi:hypothetical protein
MQQIVFSLPLSLKTLNLSALDCHLQVSQYAETATLHQCALKSHTLYSIKKLRGLSPQARTIPTERPPLLGEVNVNFSG